MCQTPLNTKTRKTQQDEIMAFVERLMSLPDLINSINTMPEHDDVAFFYQNLDLIARELEIEFRALDNEEQYGDTRDVDPGDVDE